MKWIAVIFVIVIITSIAGCIGMQSVPINNNNTNNTIQKENTTMNKSSEINPSEAEAIGTKVVNYLNSINVNKQPATTLTLISVTNYSTLYNVTTHQQGINGNGFNASVFVTKSSSLLFLSMPIVISDIPVTDSNIVMQRAVDYISKNFDSTIVSSSYLDGLYNYTASYNGKNEASFYFTADGINIFRSPLDTNLA